MHLWLSGGLLIVNIDRWFGAINREESLLLGNQAWIQKCFLRLAFDVSHPVTPGHPTCSLAKILGLIGACGISSQYSCVGTEGLPPPAAIPGYLGSIALSSVPYVTKKNEICFTTSKVGKASHLKFFSTHNQKLEIRQQSEAHSCTWARLSSVPELCAVRSRGRAVSWSNLPAVAVGDGYDCVHGCPAPSDPGLIAAEELGVVCEGCIGRACSVFAR